MKNVHERIKEFLGNRYSGAQELTQQAFDIVKELFYSGTPSTEIINFLKKGAEQFYQMVSIIKLNEHFQKKGVSENSICTFQKLLFDDSYIKNTSILFNSKKKVLTFSNSSSVRNILIHYKEALSEVICCRSLPLGEGQFLNEKFVEEGIFSTLIEDSEAARYFPKCDFILIGADAVTEDFIVNKIGTLQLVLTARHFTIPVYVAVSKLKKIERKHYLAEKLEQYFERIDISLITEIIS